MTFQHNLTLCLHFKRAVEWRMGLAHAQAASATHRDKATSFGQVLLSFVGMAILHIAFSCRRTFSEACHFPHV